MTSIPVSPAASFYAKHAVPIILAASVVSSTAEAQSAPSFDLCVHPTRPACNEDVTGGKACEPQLRAFVAAMVAYRNCLLKEAQHTIKEINEALDQMNGKQHNPPLKGTKR